jgi:6-pyruvoyltetrahydropterin/6-carboxytetrahydropterin synthase
MKLKTQFDFDSAHRLVGYLGKCRACHGHRWVVEIEVEGSELDEVGMLWDFTNVKKIKELFDHKTILKYCEENKEIIKVLKKVCGEDSVYLMDDNPTAENLSREILTILCRENKTNLVFSVRVFESPKSSCEIKNEDN